MIVNLFQRFGLAFRMATKIGSMPLKDPALASLFSVADNDTGVVVNEKTALGLSAVWSAVNLLSSSVASLPVMVYRRTGDGKTLDASHNVYRVMHEVPNRYQTAYEFKEMMMLHLLLRGNAYAEIVPTMGRSVSELIPLDPDRVSPYWVGGERAYRYRPEDGEQKVIRQDNMFHVMGPSVDGLEGLSPLEYHRRSLGISIGAEKYGARFFKNDGTPSLALSHPGQLSEKAKQNLIESYERRHSGVDNSHKLAVFEEGMTITPISIAPEDAQYIETRKFQVGDIARIFRVPNHMIGDLEKSSFNNIEQMSLEYVTYSLRPWIVRWEQAITRDLVNPSERATVFAEFLVDALLRGNTKDRYEAYSIGVQNGWLSANEIRAKENMNPIEGGDTYLVPLNMQPVGQDGDEDAPAEA